MGSHACEKGTGTFPFERTFRDASRRANRFQAKASEREVMVRESQRAIRQAMRGMATVRFMDERKLARLRNLAQRLSFIPFFLYRAAIANALEPLYGTSGTSAHTR